MEVFEVWFEEYYGENHDLRRIRFLGKIKAFTFVEACKVAMTKQDWDFSDYDEESNSYCGSRFFTSSAEAFQQAI